MGPRHGWVRLLRTAVFAFVCLALAAGAHAVAGGGPPTLGVLLLGALPVWLGCFALTSRRLGARVLTACLSLTQVGLHLFFHATEAPATRSLATGHVHGALTAGSAHTPALAPDLLGGLTPAMLFAHTVATLGCALMLAYGEDVLWRALRRLCPVPLAATPPAVAPLWQVHPEPVTALGIRQIVATPRRGPPVGPAC